MFEIPECMTIARQMAEHLDGKRVVRGTLGNSPHRFVWYNRKPREFAALVAGKLVGRAAAQGRWIFLPLEPGYVLVLGECGGRILLHQAASRLPGKYHLSLHFSDGSALSVTTRLWGAMELYEKGQERQRQYIRDMRLTPVDSRFTAAYLTRLIRESAAEGSRSVKSLLTQDQWIPGLGNSIAQDILYRARLHPRQPITELSAQQTRALHRAIVGVVKQATRLGGRQDEVDLMGHQGGYVRVMDQKAAGRPCPGCGAKVEKIAYLGGTCYFCPRCQAMP